MNKIIVILFTAIIMLTSCIKNAEAFFSTHPNSGYNNLIVFLDTGDKNQKWLNIAAILSYEEIFIKHKLKNTSRKSKDYKKYRNLLVIISHERHMLISRPATLTSSTVKAGKKASHYYKEAIKNLRNAEEAFALNNLPQRKKNAKTLADYLASRESKTSNIIALEEYRKVPKLDKPKVPTHPTKKTIEPKSETTKTATLKIEDLQAETTASAK